MCCRPTRLIISSKSHPPEAMHAADWTKNYSMMMRSGNEKLLERTQATSTPSRVIRTVKQKKLLPLTEK
jgi:hypothetical protein